MNHALERTLGMSRRAALGAIVAAGAGFVAFGPSGSDEAARRARRSGRVVLDYWEKWTDVEGRAMQRVVDDFNASQSKLYVRYLVTGTIHQKALISIAGGDPPDVIGMYSSNVPTYAEANAALPLDELARDAGLRLDDYAAGMRKVMLHAGAWWATVNTGGTLAMYYNKEMFREVGLDPEKPPRTVRELNEAHKKLVRRDEAGNITRVGHIHPEPGWWSWIWGYFFGATMWDQATDRCMADEPRNVEAYRWMQQTAAELGHDAVERFRTGLGPYGTPKQGFVRGEVGMVMQGPWLANQLVAFAPQLDYGVAPVPVEESIYDEGAPVAMVDTDVLMIPRGVKRPEASMEFIAYTQRQEVVEYLATAHCKGSPLRKVSEGFLQNHANRGVRLHTELANSARAFVAPTTPAWAEMKDVLDTTADSIWKGNVQVEARLKSTRERCQQALDRHAEQGKRRGEIGARSAVVAGIGGKLGN